LPRFLVLHDAPHGLIAFAAHGRKGGCELTLELPAQGRGELVVDPWERFPLSPVRSPIVPGTSDEKAIPSSQEAIQ
jgi:hypothetical protein